MYLNFNKNYSFKNQMLDIIIFLAMNGMVGKKKPTAICRKIASAKSGDSVEVWGMVNKPGHFFLLMNVLKVQREL